MLSTFHSCPRCHCNAGGVFIQKCDRCERVYCDTCAHGEGCPHDGRVPYTILGFISYENYEQNEKFQEAYKERLRGREERWRKKHLLEAEQESQKKKQEDKQKEAESAALGCFFLVCLVIVMFVLLGLLLTGKLG